MSVVDWPGQIVTSGPRVTSGAGPPPTEKVNDHELSVPTSHATWSLMNNVQSPSAFTPLKVLAKVKVPRGLVLKKGGTVFVCLPSGLNVPLKGGAPVVIKGVVKSVKTVTMKLSPEPPFPVESSNTCPLGAIRKI